MLSFNHKSLYPLLPRKYGFGKRQKTFLKTLHLLEKRKARILLETGTARYGLKNTKSDGASTLVFSAWAAKNNAHLYSVDHDAKAIAAATREITSLGLEGHVTFVRSDSVSFLSAFDQPVDLLYLDSFDYSKKDVDQQRLSQEHHLEEFRAIENQLHSRSIVLLDDCRLPGGGKGKMVVEYMAGKGWNIEAAGYQYLLTRLNE